MASLKITNSISLLTNNPECEICRSAQKNFSKSSESKTERMQNLGGGSGSDPQCWIIFPGCPVRTRGHANTSKGRERKLPVKVLRNLRISSGVGGLSRVVKQAAAVSARTACVLPAAGRCGAISRNLPALAIFNTLSTEHWKEKSYMFK